MCSSDLPEAIAAWNRRTSPESDNAEVYLEAYQELLQKSMNLNETLLKKLKVAPGNKPLTVEQLRKMQKQYVWIVDSNPNMTFSGWAVCDNEAVYYLYFNKDCPVGSASIDLDDGYGKTWLAYARKPEGDENNG